jgi:hypothetical protein
LLHPTVLMPTTNARPRINTPRSFCTVFPSFPQVLRTTPVNCQPPQLAGHKLRCAISSFIPGGAIVNTQTQPERFFTGGGGCLR